MICSVALIVTARTIRCANGTRSSSCFAQPGIFGSVFGEIQIGVRW